MAPFTAAVSDDRLPPIVSPDWLYAHLDDPHITIADCRFSLADPNLGHQQYANSHIPGAFYFDLNQDLSSPVQTHGGRHPLPHLEALAAKLATAGVYSKQQPEAQRQYPPTFVVAYDDSRMAFAARFWWLLRYMGHTQVAILDGGLSGWVAAGLPVTEQQPASRTGAFVPQIQPGWVVEIEQVKDKQDNPGVVLIDSREGERYRGEKEPIDPVAGHIPGAVNYPWQEVTNAQGFVLPTAQQQQRWANLGSDQELIVYCGSGVTACVNLLSLELAGIEGAKLYAGSWSDWCSYL